MGRAIDRLRPVGVAQRPPRPQALAQEPATWRTIGIGAAVVALAAPHPGALSALAPAEITPLSPIPMTSPLEGVVREIVVKPNKW